MSDTKTNADEFVRGVAVARTHQRECDLESARLHSNSALGFGLASGALAATAAALGVAGSEAWLVPAGGAAMTVGIALSDKSSADLAAFRADLNSPDEIREAEQEMASSAGLSDVRHGGVVAPAQRQRT